jgi:DNA-binding NarL/FixJ family response regulator
MRLTEREQDVLYWLLQGHTNKDIAEQLNISGYTARDHVSSLLTKHRVKSRVELMVKYMSRPGAASIPDPRHLSDCTYR